MGQAFEVRPLAVDAVSVETAPGAAPLAVVQGTLGDGCTSLFQQRQRREGNAVYVEFTTKRPQDAVCILIAQLVELRVPLDGAFPPGAYRLEVNGVEARFAL